MNDFNFIKDGKELVRIDKRTARKAFINGQSIYFCPCKASPLSMWMSLPVCHADLIFTEEPTEEILSKRFESLVNLHEYYNCCNNKLGRYTAFYIAIN